MVKKLRLFYVALVSVTLLSACNTTTSSSDNVSDTSGNADKNQENKEEMMPDSTSNLLEYDSTKTDVGR